MQHPPPPQANAQANNAPANSLNNLNGHVTQLVTEILRRHGRNILNDLINPGRDINNDVDQTIEGVANMNLADMDKIPDVVKSSLASQENSVLGRKVSTVSLKFTNILEDHQNIMGS